MQTEKILNDLISLRTDDKNKSNKECVDYICDILQKNGVLFKRLPNPDGLKENIIAGINIQGFKNINTGLILSGHMDTVGVNPKDWDTNPFRPAYINNAVYGRGTVDMKYFIAAVLAVLPDLKKNDIPVFLLFSCDEETDVQGIRVLTSFMEMRNIHPRYALVGEPTRFNLYIASKGYMGYTTTIKGVAAHSSCPELGVNAAYVGAQIIAEIEKLNQQYQPRETTLNVGTVNGGEGRNSIPSEVQIEWEIRYAQEAHKDEILQKIEQRHKELSAQYKNAYIRLETKENLPPFERRDGSRITALAHNILKTDITTMPHATEAGFLQKLGVETLICGAGDEHLAHSSSEHILISDLQKYTDFLLHFAQEIQKDLKH